MTTGRMERSFNRSIKDIPLHLRDEALVATGRGIAAALDSAHASLEGAELVKSMYLSNAMITVLRELHATPEARRAAGVIAPVSGVEATGPRSMSALSALKNADSA